MTGSISSGLTEFPVALCLDGNDTKTFDVEAGRAEVLGLERLFSCVSSCANKLPRGFESVEAPDASTFGCAINDL